MNEALAWLWTHCRAIGMTKKADPSNIDPMAMDVALFTADQKADNEQLRGRLAAYGALIEQWHCGQMNAADALTALDFLREVDATRHADQPSAAPMIAGLAEWEGDPGCGRCHKCLADVRVKMTEHLSVPVTTTFMVTCPDCGCKRCPKASDHTLACTGSNEPGQPGSIYTVTADKSNLYNKE